MKVITCLLAVLTLIGCSDNAEFSIHPSRKNLTESVYSSVTIQPDSIYAVYTTVTGILDRIFVEEGDTVKEEDDLFQITNNTPKLNTENARLSMQIAQENYNGKNAILEDLTNEIKLADLKYKNDSIIYLRQKNLWVEKIGSKAEYDIKKLNKEVSKNSLNTLKNKYLRTEVELKNQLKQAQNNYKSSLIFTKDFTLKSKINGRVYAIYNSPGELVSIQMPMATIGSKSEFIAELLVDEVDIAKIKIGQQVLITLEAYKNQVYEALVQKIYPKKDDRSQTFKIEAVFIKKPKILYPGLSGEANIIINQKKDVLVIPKIYLVNEKFIKTEEEIGRAHV